MCSLGGIHVRVNVGMTTTITMSSLGHVDVGKYRYTYTLESFSELADAFETS